MYKTKSLTKKILACGNDKKLKNLFYNYIIDYNFDLKEKAKKIQENYYSMIFVDSEYYQDQGISTIKSIRELNKSVPIIFYGSNDLNTTIGSLIEGANIAIGKIQSKKELKETAKKYLN